MQGSIVLFHLLLNMFEVSHNKLLKERQERGWVGGNANPEAGDFSLPLGEVGKAMTETVSAW